MISITGAVYYKCINLHWVDIGLNYISIMSNFYFLNAQLDLRD